MWTQSSVLTWRELVIGIDGWGVVIRLQQPFHMQVGLDRISEKSRCPKGSLTLPGVSLLGHAVGSAGRRPLDFCGTLAETLELGSRGRRVLRSPGQARLIS